MASDAQLIVCESFYSIQGEGKSAGKPAVFLRLAGCNLRCNGFTYKNPNTGEHLGCDTKHVWMQGTKRSFAEILDFWQQQGWMAKLQQGAHLIITGGEPLLQQIALINFIMLLDENIFIEIETNGTQSVQENLFQRINQFNVSPKLSHSGENKNRAYNETAIKQFVSHSGSVFKFVIANPNDLKEVLEDYVQPHQIAPAQVWLMPEGGTQERINSIKPWLVELCKQHLFNFTSRLQVDIWKEVVGV